MPPAPFRTARVPVRATLCILPLALAISAAGCATTPVSAKSSGATTGTTTSAADAMTPAPDGSSQGGAAADSEPAGTADDTSVDSTAADQLAADTTPAAGDGDPAQAGPAPDGPAPTELERTGSPAEPTQAEADFNALYGGQTYNPVADPTLPAPAQVPGAYDPWERYNRKMHTFNNAVDRSIARPLARFYVAVTPRPVRLGVSNFFNNLGQPVSAVNALLQGKPAQAGHSLGRFLLNSTLGIGGIFDPASDAKLDRRSEDFGQTLGTWGWARSRYVELPLFGPRTVRDVFGMIGDAPLSPLRQVDEDATRIPLQGLQLVDVRTQLLATDSLREGAADDYALVRDAWTQRRDYQIFGDRMRDDGDQSLPDYLRDDSNPQVPAGAMPVMPTDN
ncbi:VacJ family lipoprotein [Lysobacter sp. CW239]|uniref:MlaA family lipoprotein n=1 Tax=Lysobacteraceae TaxID=32033 RepID=UPI000690FF34|nr:MULTISPECIES: VacJ family lipoprotein [Lysobacter]QOD91147.1 VacJ family lipoprotein [Lysobacter sp. CW239]